MIPEVSYIGNLAIFWPSIIEYELTHRLRKFVTKTSVSGFKLRFPYRGKGRGSQKIQPWWMVDLFANQWSAWAGGGGEGLLFDFSTNPADSEVQR